MSITYKTSLTYREKYIVEKLSIFQQEELDLNLLYKLPEEIEQYILDYLPGLKEQVRKYCIYEKYYKKCYSGLDTFTYQEINRHFHGEDYFSISTNKKNTISNYITYNLMWPISRIKLPYMLEIVDDEKYEKMKKIIICSNVRSDLIKMKQCK